MLVATVDQGTRLLAVLRAKLASARPQSLYGTPPTQRRTFTLDPATGEWKKP